MPGVAEPTTPNSPGGGAWAGGGCWIGTNRPLPLGWAIGTPKGVGAPGWPNGAWGWPNGIGWPNGCVTPGWANAAANGFCAGSGITWSGATFGIAAVDDFGLLRLLHRRAVGKRLPGRPAAAVAAGAVLVASTRIRS